MAAQAVSRVLLGPSSQDVLCQQVTHDGLASVQGGTIDPPPAAVWVPKLNVTDNEQPVLKGVWNGKYYHDTHLGWSLPVHCAAVLETRAKRTTVVAANCILKSIVE
uniref:Uncharacterized protein n=1 Tax=Pristionchus pacificus TaxID=54126 RepID=A0A2A6C0Y4_PRIPA|eukprot:PDM71922.1 hypothetical protein PRIPAC_38329 [Pristionchus pacificus]